MKRASLHSFLSLATSATLLLLLFGCGTPGTSEVSFPADGNGDLVFTTDGTTGTSAESAATTTTTAETTTTSTTSATTTTTTTTQTTTATTKATTTTTRRPKPQIDVSGPEYEGYRLVRDAVNKLQNKKYFSVAFREESDSYDNGTPEPFNGFEANGSFYPGSSLKEPRSMWVYSLGGDTDIGTLFMCQHDKDVFCSYIINKQDVWAKKRFVANGLTENIALAEAAAAELRHLPSAEKAANAQILPDNNYSGKNKSVTIPVPADEFAQLYENAIRLFAFFTMEPDNTLKYTVRDCEVKYIINEEGYPYDTILRYYMDITGTKDGQPYQKRLKIWASMRLINYNSDTPPEHRCDWPTAEYETIDNPGALYLSTLPLLP